MKFVLLLTLILTIYRIQGISVSTKNKCQCNQITTLFECNVDCIWSDTSNVCIDPPSQLIRQGYCADQKLNCNKIEGCGLYQKICIPFSGCSSIIENTNFGCQQYSNKCVTDGNKCVEKSQCINYKTRFSCKNGYDSNYNWTNFCFWDRTICRDSQNCNELSLSLRSDQECRKQMSHCTFKAGGGCQESAELCQDQKLEQQCYTNKKGTKNCYWDGKNCYDFSCKYINSDCIKNGCSINKNQQCIDRLECEQYINQIECTFDNLNQQCMWEQGTCVIKKCENANIIRINNELCQEIDKNCITKFGGGCKTNGECEQADNKTGCKFNIRNESCYWNGFQCVLKQCQWAPVSYQSINLCKTFLSNCVYNGTQCIDGGCYSITTGDQCIANKQCQYRQQCDIKSCETAGKDIYHVTYQDCQNYLRECTLSDSGIGCIPFKYQCSQYQREIQCFQSIQGLCIWYNNQCQDSQCEYLTYSTHQQCNNKFTNCTTNGERCVKMQQQCSSYLTQQECTFNKINTPCIWSDSKCQEVTCQLIPKISTYNTHDKCNSYYYECTISETISGCIEIPETCSDMNQDQCQIDKCIFRDGVCRDKKCSDFSGAVSQSICESYIAGKKCMISSEFIPTSCVDKFDECKKIKTEAQCQTTSNQEECTWQYGVCTEQKEICTFQDDAKSCKPKTCSDTALGTNEKTDEICEKYFIECSRNQADKFSCYPKSLSDKTKCEYYVSQKYCVQLEKCFWSQTQSCQERKAECDDYSQSDCSSNSNTLGQSCALNTDLQCVTKCSTLQPTTTQSCSSLDQSCVIQGSICVNLTPNCGYESNQNSCEDDINCRWDGIECVSRQCSDMKNVMNHQQCIKYKSTCTSAYLGGCQSLKTNCSDYLNQIQCVINQNKKQCFWRSDDKCLDRKCESVKYDNTKSTLQCQNYYDDIQCVANDNVDGCIDLKDQCTQYLLNYQCTNQKDGSECQWINEKCQLSTCETLVLETYTHEECYNALQIIKCTIKSTKDGCMKLYDNCNEYLEISQCFATKSNEQCLWDSITQQCKLKTCFDVIPNDMKCSDYLSTCIESQYKCRDIVCEDYLYETDEQCQQINSNCTTNGRFCVKRGTCEQNKSEKSCNIDINNKLCGWNQSKQLCQYLTCNYAPITLIYDQTCNDYFPNQNCVSKNGGGCTQITACFDYTIDKQCNESKLYKCIWDGISCRYQKCSDHTGVDVYDCQSKLNGCTSDGKQCIEMQNCAQLQQSQCTLGLDGPCLFLKGQCMRYIQCESINMITHQECYNNLQQQCTSNGINCIPLNSCNEYLTQISCQIDVKLSKCAWNNYKCEQFISCDQYKFKTHKECNQINQNCTTNTIDSCQEFQSCSQYKFQENCKFNDAGIIIKNNLVTSTGTCSWNDNQCVDSICINLIGSTHSQCFNQLSSCTSNGTKCIDLQDTCSGYSSSECTIAQSKQGQCQMIDSTCQIADCTKITEQAKCVQIKHCQFSSNLCRSFTKCSEYTTKDLCTQGTDGQCVYKNSKCQSMTLCSDTNEQQYCNSKFCFWNDTNKTCIDHSCITYGKSNSCGAFRNYNNTILTYCGYGTGSQCLEQNPNDWDQNVCYTKSLGYYQQKDNYCSSCFIVQNNNQTNNSTQNNTNATTIDKTDDANRLQILVIMLIISLYLE